MKFIIVNSKRQWSFRLGRVLAVLLPGLGLTLGAVILIASLSGYHKGQNDNALNEGMINLWRTQLQSQNEDIAAAKSNLIRHLDASAMKIAQLQARLVRLDALGERLTEIASLNDGEFDFSQPPALGGIDAADSSASYQPPGWQEMLNDLTDEISNRERQLNLLQQMIMNRNTKKNFTLTGRPIEKGWMSSRFGYRNDPITGKRTWHRGVDFAGKEGSNVVAVAAGVVTFSKNYGNGFGLMVEIDHGGGYVTRYAHNKEVLVKAGDLVNKGDAIALMGSTGRSTGPHVHFEVFKKGRIVDPATYIHRVSK